MPLYTFLCDDCENTFETLSSMNNYDNVSCEKCHSKKCKRLLGSARPIMMTFEKKEKENLNCNFAESNAPIVGRGIYKDKRTGKFLGYGEPQIYNT